MANIKSAKKRSVTNEIRRQRNVNRRSDIKTVIKKVLAAVEEKNVDSAKILLKDAESKIARAAGKGVFKKNTASHKISLIAKKVATIAKK